MSLSLLMALAISSLCAALALAGPASGAGLSEFHLPMHLTWRHDKTAINGPSVAVGITKHYNASLIPQALCSRSIPTIINMGNFAAMPITIDVDENGDGDIVYGTKRYPITHVPELGAPFCTRMYSPERAIVDCDLMWAGASTPVEYPLGASADDCLTPATNNLFAEVDFDHQHGINDTIQTRREEDPEMCCPPRCVSVDNTSRVGNGNPHQNALNIQLSGNLNCGAATSCTVGHQQSKSFTVGASLTISCPWISAGFSVSETTTTGNSYGCTAGRGQTVCVWKNVAHTAYTVRWTHGSSCNPKHATGVIKSPNRNNHGGGYYCVVGTCRSQGSRYWDDSGP